MSLKSKPGDLTINHQTLHQYIGYGEGKSVAEVRHKSSTSIARKTATADCHRGGGRFDGIDFFTRVNNQTEKWRTIYWLRTWKSNPAKYQFDHSTMTTHRCRYFDMMEVLVLCRTFITDSSLMWPNQWWRLTRLIVKCPNYTFTTTSSRLAKLRLNNYAENFTMQNVVELTLWFFRAIWVNQIPARLCDKTW